ncbi:hypothetical protein K7G91_000866 [Pasteurella canis]|uniref:hypothetical protein n=1 Tax=Pasteurella canis TaxID=753 RepID=UPI0006689584|nr:hypothetical protein [Pasteurella canis]UDW84581.1 hypothetical protein K7G91_000866 [Pasteurella canis]
MNEPDFTRAVHKKISQDGVWVWKICDAYMGGIPDAYYRHRKTGRALWVEYKYLKSLPKLDSTRVVPNLSALQKKLLRETVESGQSACVIVGYKNTGVVFETTSEWENGIEKSEFEKRSLSYKQLAEYITCKVS